MPAFDSVKSHKRVIDSTLLGRMAHADVFEIGTAARFVFILFGGSGVDDEEYIERGKTVIPVFDRLLGDLAGNGVDVVLIHITAPYDVPFNRFSIDRSSAEKWTHHVLAELTEPWSKLPYFVCGFSGGTALALNGVHEHQRCFGAAGLGADGIPEDFVCPSHWKQKLRLYSAPNDAVCNRPENRRIVASLEARQEAEEFSLSQGRHRLADYATPYCLGDLIRFAEGLVPCP